MKVSARLFGFVVKSVLRIFYRRWEVVGLENVPADGPCLVLSNHNNAMVDPLVVARVLPRSIRYVAKATLWKNPFFAAILNLTDAIPIARMRDLEEMQQGVDATKEMNRQTFAELHATFERGECVGMFPEGVSHAHSVLKRLKSGAALAALEYAESTDFKETLPLLPVGLSWSKPGRFRSDVAVVIGEPVDSTPFHDMYRERGRRAIVPLTRKLKDALLSVTLLGASARLQRRVGRACGLLTRLNREDPERYPMPIENGKPLRGVNLRRRAISHAAALQEAHPERYRRLGRAIRRLEALERAAGLSPEAWGPIGRPPCAWPPVRCVLELLLTLITLPLVAAGTILWGPVYFLIRVLVRVARRLEPDEAATLKVYLAIVVSPLWLLALSTGLPFLAEALDLPWWVGLEIGLLSPLLGFWAYRRIEATVEILEAGIAVFRRASVARALVFRRGRAAHLLKKELLDEEVGATPPPASA